MQEEPLTGWKSVAEHLGVSVRTAQRLEEEGLPVHRPAGGGRGRKAAVFAFPSRLNEWVRSREQLESRAARRNELLERLPPEVRRFLDCFGPRPLYVLSWSLLYSFFFGSAVVLELTYELADFRRLAIGGSLLTSGWVLISTALIFLFAEKLIRLKSPLCLSLPLLALIAAAMIQVAVMSLYLPQRPIVLAEFQTHAASAAYFKDTIYALIIGCVFMFPPYVLIRTLETAASETGGRLTDRLGGARLVAAVGGVLYFRPWLLVAILFLTALTALALMTHLLDHLILNPYTAVFQKILWARMFLFLALGAGTAFWFRNQFSRLEADARRHSRSRIEGGVERGEKWSTALSFGAPVKKGIVAACVVAGLAAALFILMPVPSEPVFSVEVQGDRLHALNRNGEVLWSYQWEREIRPLNPDGKGGVFLIDLNGDGKEEILAILTPGVFHPETREKVVCLDSSGSVLWEYMPGRERTWDETEYLNQYSIRDFSLVDAGRPAQKHLVVVANHVPYSPSQVSILNPKGELVGEYWHTGYIFTHAVADLNGDGRPALVLGGINNLFGKPALAVVPLDIQGAISPSPPSFAPGLESGKELDYRLFPRTDVSRNLNLDSRVARIRVTPEKVLMVEIELRRDPFAPGGRMEERVYQIAPDLQFQRLAFPRPFIAFHDEQFRDGRLDHEFESCPTSGLHKLVAVGPKELAGLSW